MKKKIFCAIFILMFMSSAVWPCPDVVVRMGDQVIVKRDGEYFIEQGDYGSYWGQSAPLEYSPYGMRIYDSYNGEYVLIRRNGDTCHYSEREKEEDACGSGSQF